MSNKTRAPKRVAKTITIKQKLTVDVGHDGRGRVVIHSRIEGARQPGEGWGCFFVDWVYKFEDQLASLRKYEVVRDHPGLEAFLVRAVTKECRKLARHPEAFGVPLSAMPRGIKPSLYSRPNGSFDRKVRLTTDLVPNIGPVFATERFVIRGRAPRGAKPEADEKIRSEWKALARHHGIELEPVAYSGTRQAGVVWFAQKSQIDQGRDYRTEKACINAGFYLYLRRAFPNLRFSLIMSGGTPLLALHDGRNRVGFCELESLNGARFNLILMPTGAERIRKAYESDLMSIKTKENDETTAAA
jgi:hypothetical protein